MVEGAEPMTWERVWSPVVACATGRGKQPRSRILEHSRSQPQRTGNTGQKSTLAFTRYNSDLFISSSGNTLNHTSTLTPTAPMSSNVLSLRDNNAQLRPSPSPEKEKPKSLEYHRQVLQSRMGGEQYVYASYSRRRISNKRKGPSNSFLRLTTSSLPPHKSCKPSRTSTP